MILAGSFLIERIYNIDGFGLLGFESLVERDYPVVMGILVISSLLFLVGNILSDICVALVDPRVKFGTVTCGAPDFHRRPASSGGASARSSAATTRCSHHPRAARRQRCSPSCW